MIELRSWGFALVLAPGLLCAQENPGNWAPFRANVEVKVPDLQPLKARTHDPSEILLTSLDIAFHNSAICCGRNSALDERAVAANPLLLQEVAAKIQGKWLLSDGRPIQIVTEYIPTASSGDISYKIVQSLRGNRPMLLVWNSHLYVLYGAIFDEAWAADTGGQDEIHKLLLLDPRYSDSRRQVIFDRDADDWGKVRGLLLLNVSES